MAQASLVLHCGARQVTREELAFIPCPPAEGRWRPVPHVEVLDHAVSALTDAGYSVEKMCLGLSRGDARFFGTLTLKTALVEGVSLAVGVRSSFDKSISLQWACGSRVFVCDNLAFTSEKVIARKHTTRGVLRYHEAICQAVAELGSFRSMEEARIRSLQKRIVDDHYAESMLLRLYQDHGALSPRSLPVALSEWRKPSFEVFAETKNAFRLLNACTWAIREKVQSNPQAHAAATIRLSRLLEVESVRDPSPSLLSSS